MSLQRLTEDFFETFTVETNPSRTYSSSSSGITGSVSLFARNSSIVKEVVPLSAFSQSFYNDENLEEFRKDILRITGSTDITDAINNYFTAVNAQQSSTRLQQQVEILRFTPPFSLNSNSLRKRTTINTVMPYYRTVYPSSHFNYVNYHSLNFYSASNVPSSSVILYPNPDRTYGTLTEYGFTGSFSFDFWIKPRYTGDGSDNTAYYKPGALFHLSSSYAVCLHSGSSKDINGKVNAFKLSLQLTSATDTRPDQIASSQNWVFFSNDNALPINEWSHVTIRWGGTDFSYGTGSFLVNAQNRGNFVITSSLAVGESALNPNVLCVGNYYEGENAGGSELSAFFTGDTANREGLYELQTGAGFAPSVFDFTYPLQAEVHELKIYQRMLNDTEVITFNSSAASLESDLLFYVPPLFTEESPTRTFYDGEGGIPVTPFFTRDGQTKHPFATEMAFGCGGHFINLENYGRDFATGRYPRWWALTSSLVNTATTTALSANTILYSTGSNLKRLYTILPNDNGNVIPNFNLLLPLSSSTFKTDLGVADRGVISLREMISSSFPADTVFAPTGALVDGLVGGNTPDDVGALPGDSLAVYHRTRDASSNQVVFFDISNLFYGKSIKPGSFVLSDSNLSGSSDKIGMTLRDDGIGGLYRADVTGSRATWASVGSIFYNEGVVMLKSPQLYFFGENQFDVEFLGEQDIHVLTVNAYARPLQLVSSSKPGYFTGSLDDLANVTDKRYTFITNVYLHDDNLNVIARTNTAQPILKRSGDKMVFKIKMDF